ncbi:P-loop containing nucleoside triphosphate hydrolase protein [Ascodesmis nigricans]|uniref:P-loop containing nucleoside triphosphate hydrolase protein n=1 Tax=Ascodesmis nigricans TaxID=341454 RepID=A0A4S2MZ67_9PEZI|nr:P-loop containing nucleoside triphosphate hydrolase protein [Ascodesmis nigricans]
MTMTLTTPAAKPPTIITIAGGHASGKKNVQHALETQLVALHPGLKVKLLHLDDFPSEKARSEADGNRNPDPERLEAFDLNALYAELHRLKTLPPDIPDQPNVVIAEGPYLLRHPGIVEIGDINIFVDCDADIRLARRVTRDLASGLLPLSAIFEQHVRYSKRSFEQYIAPTKVLSDIILPAGAIEAGVELVARGVVDDVTAGVVGKGRRRGREVEGVVGEREAWGMGEGREGEWYDTV